MKKITRYYVELVKDKTALYDLESKRIRTPQDGYKIIEEVFSLSSKPNEHFVMLCLNTKNEVIGAHTLHIGTINMSVVGVRDVFQSALLNNASSIMLGHNHPSQDVTASPEDLKMTQRLTDAGRLMGVPVIDHVIVGESNFTSLREQYSDMFE
ncbi:JAB domain-containing protein [Solibacillus sp. FSL H8-0523]|uniref:JAB domain-containing protein n=1 Tax=Solibacillus sp. FSL H8-0523 TaxID=2954511 RepID=UPI003101322A